MSQYDVKQVACHQCQAPIDVKVYETIDVTDQSPEREAILSGEFFKVKCPECGYEGMADYGFLYQDLQKGIVLFYEPDPSFFEEDVQVLKDTFTPEQMAVTTIRIVHGLPNLWEKIQIHEAGLDDRIVELQKYLVFAGFHQQMPDQPIKHILYALTKEGKAQFLLGDDHELVATVAFDQGQYDLTKDSFAQELARYGGGFFINQQWAEWLMAQLEQDQD